MPFQGGAGVFLMLEQPKISGILDARGQPMAMASAHVPPPTPYAGADSFTQELGNWFPRLDSANSEYLWDRDKIVARTRDLVRNSGWSAGAVTRWVDNIVGSGFRLSARPDYRALGQPPEWAAEWAPDVEGRFRIYAEDPDHWMDAARHDNLSGMLGQACRHDFVDGESFAAVLWIDDKPFGKYATTFQMLDPDRVTNPNQTFDTPRLRAGIAIDDYGAASGYWVRAAHPADWPQTTEAFRWEFVPRETDFGRRQMLHSYEKARAGQLRGVSAFAPIIERLKMIDKYDKVELQAAVFNAIMAAYIESPFDHDMLDETLSTGQVGQYQTQRAAYHKENRITLGGLAIPKLYPGEKLCLRNIASAVGLTYEQLSQDWSSTNYSSARASLLEVWRGFLRVRQRISDQVATPVFSLWLEEAIHRGDVKLPKGAPDFYTAKAAYCRVKWIGPPRGWVDPVKEGQAAQIRMNLNVSTLEDECAEQGKDWEEVLHQRKRELDLIDSLGLPRPAWADQLTLSPTGRPEVGAPPPEDGNKDNSKDGSKQNEGN
jgi:lambda family phage portal protein